MQLNIHTQLILCTPLIALATNYYITTFIVAVFDERLVGPLQLQVSTRGLFAKSISHEGKCGGRTPNDRMNQAIGSMTCQFLALLLMIIFGSIFLTGRLSSSISFSYPVLLLDGQHLLVVLHIKVHRVL